MATTQARISQSVNTKKKGKCRPTTKALIITHMPRLSKSSRKVPAVRAQWGKFIRYVKRHEVRHKSTYIGCTEKIKRLNACILPQTWLQKREEPR